MKTNGRNPDKASMVMRETRAAELRRSGASYAEIGAELRCSPSTAYRAVMRALTRNLAEAVEELRVVEGSRLDRLQLAVWDAAERGDLRCIDRVLKIMERRAKLFALDMLPSAARGTPELDAEVEWLVAALAGTSGGESSVPQPSPSAAGSRHLPKALGA